jgi:dUTP pyrophosphatase
MSQGPSTPCQGQGSADTQEAEAVLPSIQVRVKYLHPVWHQQPVRYETGQSAGADLRACLEQEELRIEPGATVHVPSGLAIEILTPGWAGFVVSRSGLGTKEGLVVAQGVGVIDPDYRGEVVVALHNLSAVSRRIVRGQRIAQLLFLQAARAEFQTAADLTASARGAGGFGHTGQG